MRVDIRITQPAKASRGGSKTGGSRGWGKDANRPEIGPFLGEKGQRTRGPQKLKFTYKEQKDYETIEGEIAALEEKNRGLRERHRSIRP